MNGILRSLLTATLLTIGITAAVSPVVARDDWPWPSERFDKKKKRNVAGEFDYYALVLSWSPTYCATNDRPDKNQCNRRDGRRFAFVLHGLWPQYNKGYPASCRTRRRPFVPQETIDSMLDIMPSPGLVIHEYRKHGTCSGLGASRYYTLSRQLFEKIRIPKRYQNPFETQFVSPQKLTREFARANPQLAAGSIAVVCESGNRARLRELRFCFSRDGRSKACGQNERAAKLCRASQLFIPPVRSTHHEGSETGSSNSSRSKLLPLPKLR